MQPFVMVAAPGSLQHVKDMGFKTFDKFWDESYDQEQDHKIRFQKILKILEEINSWSNEIKADFTYVVKDILEYNVRHLNTMKNIEIDNLVEKYGH
jgi:hypothetical protein